MTTEAERDCKHGQLARSCNVCELESEVARQAAEIERLKVYEQEAMYMAEKTGCLAADVLADNYLLATSELEAEIERLKATMRQSLRLLREAAPNGYGLGSEQEASIAAIKQHLGEV